MLTPAARRALRKVLEDWKVLENWTGARHIYGCLIDLLDTCDEMEAEIRRLRAEVERLKIPYKAQPTLDPKPRFDKVYERGVAHMEEPEAVPKGEVKR